MSLQVGSRKSAALPMSDPGSTHPKSGQNRTLAQRRAINRAQQAGGGRAMQQACTRHGRRSRQQWRRSPNQSRRRAVLPRSTRRLQKLSARLALRARHL
jgi:hypothetical protein